MAEQQLNRPQVLRPVIDQRSLRRSHCHDRIKASERLLLRLFSQMTDQQQPYVLHLAEAFAQQVE